MDSTSSMLCEKPKVQFGGTQEWVYREDDLHLPRNAVKKELTKDNDGPNEYSLLKGKVISEYLMNVYRTKEDMYTRYGKDTIDTLGEYLERDIGDIITHLSKNPSFATYYMDYRFKSQHIPHLTCLKNLIHISVLETRFQSLLDTVSM